MDDIKVSVLLVTYNQQDYIAEALNSVLMQEHDYNYEVIIADDCSTDDTPHIIRKFQDRYPYIKLIQKDKNIGITKNYQTGFQKCTGDYVAVLEGDDYWTSPHRIRTLVEFLESNLECVIAFNPYVVQKPGMTPSLKHNVVYQPQILTVSDLIRNNFIGNFSTCMYRNDAIKSLDGSLYNMKVYDWMFNIAVSQHGLIGYIPQIMSVYRRHPGGVWTQKSLADRIRETIGLIDEYNKYLNYEYDSQFTQHKNRLLSRLNRL